MNKIKKLRLIDTFFKCSLRFFIFSQEIPQNFKNLQKKSSKKCTKVACTFSPTLRAHVYLHWPKQFQTPWGTKLHICWRFSEDSTSIGWAIDPQKNVTYGQTDKQTDKQTNNCQIYIRICFFCIQSLVILHFESFCILSHFAFWVILHFAFWVILHFESFYISTIFSFLVILDSK